MTYKFGQDVEISTEFYSGTIGAVINYEYYDWNIPEQQHKYQVRLYIQGLGNGWVDKWFYENELELMVY